MQKNVGYKVAWNILSKPWAVILLPRRRSPRSVEASTQTATCGVFIPKICAIYIEIYDIFFNQNQPKTSVECPSRPRFLTILATAWKDFGTILDGFLERRNRQIDRTEQTDRQNCSFATFRFSAVAGTQLCCALDNSTKNIKIIWDLLFTINH